MGSCCSTPSSAPAPLPTLADWVPDLISDDASNDCVEPTSTDELKRMIAQLMTTSAINGIRFAVRRPYGNFYIVLRKTELAFVGVVCQEILCVLAGHLDIANGTLEIERTSVPGAQVVERARVGLEKSYARQASWFMPKSDLRCGVGAGDSYGTAFFLSLGALRSYYFNEPQPWEDPSLALSVARGKQLPDDEAIQLARRIDYNINGAIRDPAVALVLSKMLDRKPYDEFRLEELARVCDGRREEFEQLWAIHGKESTVTLPAIRTAHLFWLAANTRPAEGDSTLPGQPCRAASAPSGPAA